MDDDLTQCEILMQLVREAVDHDMKLREKYRVGDKFRFVRDRLQALLTEVETHLASLQPPVTEESQTKEDIAQKTPVYVYLYNAQGAVLKSWTAMLTPKVFYEYSVNRPIYSEKNHVESLLKSKKNSSQHGYLTVFVHNKDILPSSSSSQDVLGNSLLKIREGALHFSDFIAFTHNGQEYVLNAQGELVMRVPDKK